MWHLHTEPSSRSPQVGLVPDGTFFEADSLGDEGEDLKILYKMFSRKFKIDSCLGFWAWCVGVGRAKELRSTPAILSFNHLALPDMAEHGSYSGNNYNFSPRPGEVIMMPGKVR